MKEIGEFLKSSRINNGVSLEEAAEDLNLATTQLENIEDGNIRAFKDVYVLRDLVKEYGKYLGVETDNIIDEFNDFMFDHTSKISLDDILESRKLAKELEDKNRVASPYTKIKTPKIRIDQIQLKFILISIGIITFLFLFLFIWLKLSNPDKVITSELQGKGEKVYEFTY